MLAITREEFRSIYAGLPILESEDLFYSEPNSDADLKQNYLPSKLWRLNNIYTIIDKYGNKIKFRMNKSQHRVHAATLRHPRVIVLKSRQQGISTYNLVNFFDDGVTKKNFRIGLMAQGQDEASTLLERVKFLWEELKPSIKNHFKVSLSRDNTKEFALSNKSIIFIRTSFRSTTLQRLHISEMGKIANKYPDKAKETKTGTLQAVAQGMLAVIESTAEGDNMFKDMWDNAVTYALDLSPKDFYPVFLSWLDDPDCVVEVDQPINSNAARYFTELEAELGIKLTRQQKNFWIVQYRELGERIYQEYPSTPVEAFMATKDGAYYAKLWMMEVKQYNREVDTLYDKNLAVQVAIDLGMNDTNCIGAFQYYDEQFRIFDELADSGQPIKYYCDWMKDQEWFSNLTHVILPHDAEVKELTSGKTRKEVFEEELAYDKNGVPTNITITVLERTSSINEDIHKVRTAMTRLWITKKCQYLKYCILNYKKEWDEKREKWRDKPLHDDASNGADCLRYMVLGVDTEAKYKKRDIHSGEFRDRVVRDRDYFEETYGGKSGMDV